MKAYFCDISLLISKAHNSILKNFGLVFILRILQMSLGFATTYFLAHSLTQEHYGEYHLILSVSGILTMFALRGLNNSIMQSIARGYKGTYRAAVPIAFTSSLIGSLTLLIIASWYMYDGNKMLSFGFIIAGLLFSFTHGLIQWKGVKTGKEDFKSLVKLDSFSAMLMHAGMITSIVLYPESFLLPLCVLFAVPAFFNIFLTHQKMKEISLDEPSEEGNIKYGIQTTFYEGFNILAKHVDKLLLFFFLSPIYLAVFVAADRISELVRNTTQDLSAVLAPRFAQHKEYSPELDRALKLFSFVMAIGILIFSFTLLPWLIVFLFGDEYATSVPYSQALMCSVAIGNLAILRFRFIRSRLDTESFRNIIVTTSLFRIACSLVFIPLWGLSGAVISVFLYRLSMIFVVNTIIKKTYIK